MKEAIWIIMAIALSVLLLAIGMRFTTLADRRRVRRRVEKQFGTLLALAPCQETSEHEHRAKFSSYWVAEAVDDRDQHHRVRCRCGLWRCEVLQHQPLDADHMPMPQQH